MWIRLDGYNALGIVVESPHPPAGGEDLERKARP